MNPGDKVRHKISGQIMTVKQINKYVAICELSEAEKLQAINLYINSAVCRVENLEKI